MLPLLVLLGTIAGAWYLLIVRPQREQQTRHGRLVDQLQVGDHVLTVGGIYGRVVQLDGAGVVLELAPGLTTRISTDGVARIVQGAEASLPTSTPVVDAAPAMPITPRTTQDTDMQQQHRQPHQHPRQSDAPGMPQPVYQPPLAPVLQQPAMPVSRPVPEPVPMLQPTTTIRAAVAPSLPTWEPRPWQDVAPVTSTMHPAAVAMAPAPAAPAAMQYEARLPAPPPMPVHVPFAAAAVASPVATPVAYAAPASMPSGAPISPSMSIPQHAPLPAPEDSPTGPQRSHSRAPQGMGSSLRLDDPSLRDTMIRARGELAGLAEEYRRHVAPLVQLEEPLHPDHQHVHPSQLAEPVLVGHDPRGVPLFAAPGSPVAVPIERYPAPARPATVPAAMPRPVVPMQVSGIDPALSRGAFQRRTPYAPDPALLQSSPEAMPVHA